jgi:phosphoglycolate phosphatase
MKKVIVFDLDGTLVNTIYDIGSSMNKALLEHGFKENALDDYYNFIGEGVIVLTRKAIGVDVSDDILQSVLNRYNEIYHENSMVLSKPYPNMIEVLDELLTKGYRLAVISNKPDIDTKNIVKHYFGDRFFYVVGWKKEVERKAYLR